MEEAMKFQADCYCCQEPGENYMCVCTIPFFKEIIITCFKCENCGYKTSEVKGGGGMSEKAIRYTLNVETSEDLLTFGLEEIGGKLHSAQHATWNFEGSQLLTTGPDKRMFIYDPRSPDAAQSYVIDKDANTKKQVVLFGDNDLLIGLISMGSSRKIRLWSQKAPDKSLQTMDLDSNAGQLNGHYDPDNHVLYVANKGDSSIKYFEIVDNNIYFLASHSDTSAHKGACLLPKRGLDVKVNEVAKCLRLVDNTVIPISLRVPRKSELFQKDLYPNTYAGVPALKAQEWKEGKNASPVLTSMAPGAAAPAPAAAPTTYTHARSAKDYEEEIAALKKKVAELEAAVAAKKS